MNHGNSLDLGVDMGSIKSHEDYKKLWGKIAPLEIRCVEKNEECRHNVGDVFVYANPYLRPEGVCEALLHVLDLYVWRAALGFPSWNESDRSVFRLHCPDPRGTVWEMRKKDCPHNPQGS